MKGSTSSQLRRCIVTAVVVLTSSLLTCATGCSSAGTAAANAAKAAGSQIATNAASNATATLAARPAAMATVSTKRQSIWGRWVRKVRVIDSDGSLTDHILTELVFKQNGSFMSQSRASMTATTLTTGSFQIRGNVLTTRVGKIQQTVTYQIKGGELSITNPKTHQIVVFVRS